MTLGIAAARVLWIGVAQVEYVPLGLAAAGARFEELGALRDRE